jgi:phage-related baseplate assembly protein
VTYAAEPYAQFVDDLLVSLTGGVTRERFTFLPEAAPYRLSPGGTLVPSTLVVFGVVDGAYARFQAGRDFVLGAEREIQWRTQSDGTRAPGAVWPDEASAFFANYDAVGVARAAPILNDRNPGSVTRLLAESFAREFAVLSRQLASVYDAAFLATAGGRDLDQVVRLVGVERRTHSFATGAVIFAANAPVTGDITINAGTRLSTGQPPPVVFETTEDRTLRRGDLTVEVPIRATVSGPPGVVPGRAISVIHRPILGVDSVSNSQATTLAGEDETDEALRARAGRALEGAGRATRGALLAALGTLPSVKEKFVRIEEDHLTRPGVVIVNVAAELTAADAARAVQLLEEARPAGVRLLHNIDAPPALVASVPPNPQDDPLAGSPPPSAVEGLYQPVRVRALILPASPSPGGRDRTALQAKGRAALKTLIAEAGIGETLVYNRLVAALMGLDGVLDVALEVYARPAAGETAGPRHQNVALPKTLRPKLADEDLTVEIASEIVAFDVVVTLQLSAEGKALGAEGNLADARIEVAGLLQDRIGGIAGEITPARLKAQLPATSIYAVTTLGYTVQYLEAGLRVNETDPPLTLGELERAWVRTVKLTDASG